MPESVESPGTFWAYPDSVDRDELLERCRQQEIWGYIGRATFNNGTRGPIEVFVPRDIDQIDQEDRLDTLCAELDIKFMLLLPVIEES